MSSRRIQALLVAFALAVSLPVAAAPAPSGRKAEAVVHFQRGKALFAQGAYADALVAFQAGFDVFPLRGFLVNIAQCQRRLGRLDDAASSYAKFLDSVGGDPRLRAEVEDALADVRGQLRAKEEARAQLRTNEEARAAGTPPPRAASPAEEPRGPSLSRSSSSVPAAALVAQPLPPQRKKTRAWVWAVVGVVAAGAVAGGVTAGLLLSHPSPSGSLGVIDGRR
jgi:hypothetical protein